MSVKTVVAQIIINQFQDGEVQVMWSGVSLDTQALGMLEVAKIVYTQQVVAKRPIRNNSTEEEGPHRD